MKKVLGVLFHHTPRPSRSIRIAEGAALSTLCIGALYLAGHLVAFEYGRDQGIYAVVAETVLQGEAPYKEAWDFKPPAIYFFFALSRVLFGASMHAVRVLEALGLASLFHAFLVLSRRHMGDVRPGILGGLAAVFGYVTLDYWHTAQPESVGAFALAWAWVCATYAPRESEGGRARLLQYSAWTAAAALYAIAALLKPFLGGGALVSLLIILWKRRREQRAVSRVKRFAAPLLCFLSGGLLPFLAVLA